MNLREVMEKVINENVIGQPEFDVKIQAGVLIVMMTKGLLRDRWISLEMPKGILKDDGELMTWLSTTVFNEFKKYFVKDADEDPSWVKNKEGGYEQTKKTVFLPAMFATTVFELIKSSPSKLDSIFSDHPDFKITQDANGDIDAETMFPREQEKINQGEKLNLKYKLN